MSELKAFKVVSAYIEYEDGTHDSGFDFEAYDKDDADKVIAELKLAYKEACDRLQTATLIKDKQIEELKAKLEDAKATAYEESVDAGMENRRLKRALYKACANWAHFAVAFFSSYATKERWHNMEIKCLKKAKEYK